MKSKTSTTLVTGTIAALLAGSTWAASDSAKESVTTSAPTKAEPSQSERDQPKSIQPMTQTPQLSTTTNDRIISRTPLRDNPLYTRSADDLDGADVVDSTGDKVGKVKQIVLSPDRKSAYVMISVGGLLGMGTHDIMVSLNDLRPVGDSLQMNSTKKQIEAGKDVARSTDKYVELKGNAPISESIVEFPAFADDQRAGTSRTPKTDAIRPKTEPETPKAPQ